MPPSDFVIRNGQRVVMIGDSITDCGRRGDHAPLGRGYVMFLAAQSAARHPQRRIEFINVGVGGDRVIDLVPRWQQDVLDRRPDWLSVSIGINDVWRQLDGKAPGVLLEEFVATYRELLERTRAACPGCGLILMTPGVLGEQPDSEGNRLLVPYIEAVDALAGRFDAFCVPVHAAFARAIAAGRGRRWTTDGVHPNLEGHALMAQVWLETLGA